MGLKKLFSFENGREVFEFSLLSGLYGLITLVLFLRLNIGQMDSHLSAPETKQLLFDIYLASWAVLPLVGVGLTLFLKHFLKKGTPSEQAFLYPCFIFFNFFYSAALIFPSTKPLYYGGLYAVIFVLCQLAALWLFKKTSKSGLSFSIFERRIYGSVTFIALIWIARFHKGDLNFSSWGFLNCLIFILAIASLYFGAAPGLKTPKRLDFLKGFLLYGSVFLLIFFLVFDTNFRYITITYSYFMGPLADLMAGKSLMYNINAQYGVLNFYFLKLFFSFVPLGWTSFSLLILLLQGFQYFIFYFITRQVFQGWIMPLFVTLSLILVNNFAQEDYYSFYPSTGPLRFGFAYLLMALILLRLQYPKNKNLFFALESLVFASAFFWSFDVCFYTIPAYSLFALYESLVIEGSLRFDLRLFLERVSGLILCLLLVGAYLCWDIYDRTGGLPHLKYYLDYIFLYKNGFGMVFLPISGYWWLIVGTLYFSVIAIICVGLEKYRSGKALPPQFNAIVFLTLYGIFQFFYYLGRSDNNNLYHISMPSLLLAFYWFYQMRQFDPAAIPTTLKKVVFTLSILAVAIYIQPIVPVANKKINDQLAPLPVMVNRTLEAFQNIPRDDAYSTRVLPLMEKYSGDKKNLVYFFGDENLNVSIYTHRVQMYPYNDWEQACICPPVMGRIFAFQPDLKIGDCIYYDTEQMTEMDKHRYGYFEDYLLADIKKRFDLKIVKTDKSIVVAEVVRQKQAN